MRYRNKTFSFLSKLRAASNTSYVSIYRKDGSLYLDAGEEYVICPLSLEDVKSRLEASITVRVKDVHPLISDIVIVGPEPTEKV